MYSHKYTEFTVGTIIEGPSNVTYIPGHTQLPIKLTCNVTGVALWRVNGTNYTLTELANGTLSGHNHTETNILVNSPVNNTEYFCVSSTNDGTTRSNLVYVVIAGKDIHNYIVTYVRSYAVCIKLNF